MGAAKFQEIVNDIQSVVKPLTEFVRKYNSMFDLLTDKDLTDEQRQVVEELLKDIDAL
jgi:flagellar capping protein FliD